MNQELTADQQEVLAELVTHHPSSANIFAAERFLSGCPSTVCALRALAQAVLNTFEDPDGAALLESFAEQFAPHEAKMM